jgi:hypothetical protein
MSSRRPSERRGHPSGTALGRGIGLLVVAVVIGVIVLHSVSRSATVPTTQTAATTATTSPHTGTSSGRSTTTLATRPPSQVVTLVANGTHVAGAAGRVNTVLQKAGYNVLAPTNSTATVNSTTVYFAAGYDREGVALANSLSLGPSTVQPMPASPPVANLRGANVLVVVGPDLANQTSTGSSPAGGSSTTAG